MRTTREPESNNIIHGNYKSGNLATLYLGDRLELLQQIKASNDKAHLIVTSPPYNIGKEYEIPVSLEEYVSGQAETIRSCVEILAEDGSICWQVGHYIEGKGRAKEAFPLDSLLYPIFKEAGLVLKNRIVWHFGHGLHEKIRFSGRHETILWFTRSAKYKFNLDPVRVPQKYPGKRSYSGKKRGLPSGNPKGKNPSDVWEMPNVKANHIEKTIHPCQFPVALVERLILALTDKNDLVIDPYLGVGSSAVAAIKTGRRIAGADIEQQYLNIAKDRIHDTFSGKIKTRPLNKPIYKPSGSEAVSQIPLEWRDETQSQ